MFFEFIYAFIYFRVMYPSCNNIEEIEENIQRHQIEKKLARKNKCVNSFIQEVIIPMVEELIDSYRDGKHFASKQKIVKEFHNTTHGSPYSSKQSRTQDSSQSCRIGAPSHGNNKSRQQFEIGNDFSKDRGHFHPLKMNLQDSRSEKVHHKANCISSSLDTAIRNFQYCDSVDSSSTFVLRTARESDLSLVVLLLDLYEQERRQHQPHSKQRNLILTADLLQDAVWGDRPIASVCMIERVVSGDLRGGSIRGSPGCEDAVDGGEMECMGALLLSQGLSVTSGKYLSVEWLQLRCSESSESKVITRQLIAFLTHMAEEMGAQVIHVNRDTCPRSWSEMLRPPSDRPAAVSLAGTEIRFTVRREDFFELGSNHVGAGAGTVGSPRIPLPPPSSPCSRSSSGYNHRNHRPDSRSPPDRGTSYDRPSMSWSGSGAAGGGLDHDDEPEYSPGRGGVRHQPVGGSGGSEGGKRTWTQAFTEAKKVRVRWVEVEVAVE